ncbi:MAG: segregation/condensation protein A, partial [Acetobacteraceae bacterium]
SHFRLDIPTLLAAYLAALKRGRSAARYRPPPLSLWTVQNALERLGRLLGSLPDWRALERFLPEHLVAPTERRAALAATLLASLEMARDGALRLRQERPFGPILLGPRTGAGTAP